MNSLFAAAAEVADSDGVVIAIIGAIAAVIVASAAAMPLVLRELKRLRDENSSQHGDNNASNERRHVALELAAERRHLETITAIARVDNRVTDHIAWHAHSVPLTHQPPAAPLPQVPQQIEVHVETESKEA